VAIDPDTNPKEFYTFLVAALRFGILGENPLSAIMSAQGFIQQAEAMFGEFTPDLSTLFPEDDKL
jgi:hypothetical protein